MPNVKAGNHGHTGLNPKERIRESMQPSMPRDDLDGAYGGSENKGPAANEKTSFEHSTNVKGRVTEKSKQRTPIRD